MLKRLATLSAVIVLAATVVPARAEDKMEESPYFPLKVGNTWTYKPTGLPLEGKVVLKVTKHEKMGDTLCAVVQPTVEDKPLGKPDYYAVKKDGIYRYTLGGNKLETPMLILKLPPKKGDEWKVEGKLGTEKVSGKATVTEEKLTVPAGKYDAFAVTSKLEGGGQTLELTNYFVKDIGLAQIKMELFGAPLEFALEKFTPAK